jgi:hypothetical protein
MVPLETEERPNKKKNPRYFLKCDGRIVFDGTVAKIERDR